MEFKTLLRQLRFEFNMNQEELAHKLGVSKSTVAMYETGRRTPSAPIYEALADIFNVDIDYLYLKSPIRQKIHFDIKGNPYTNVKRGVEIKVLGNVSAGIPISAIEDIVDSEEITEEMASKGDHFGLLIKGDSMSPRILEGDVVIVRVQSDADSGDIVIAKVNGEEACCKKLIKNKDGITLQSFNPNYDPMYFNNKDIETLPVTIVGVVVELRGKFKN